MAGRDLAMHISQPPMISLIAGSLDVHRADYMELFSRVLLNSVRAPVPPPLLNLCWKPGPLFFLTLEDHPLAFLATAMVRSALGRKTVALLLRPGDCLRHGWQYRMNRALFPIVSKMPGATILSILPFSIAPRFAQVATEWIDDPQLWDMSVLECPQATDADKLSKQIREAAGGRNVVLALGGQYRKKGFEFYSRIWCNSATIRDNFLFCAAGAISQESEAAKDRLQTAGGLVIDRSLENAELLHLYQTTSAIWSCYAPDHDQASGMFSRAIQFGAPSIVRSGSFIEKIAAEYDHQYLAVPFDCLEVATVQLLNWRPERRTVGWARARTDRSRERTIEVLRRAFGDQGQPEDL